MKSFFRKNFSVWYLQNQKAICLNYASSNFWQPPLDDILPFSLLKWEK